MSQGGWHEVPQKSEGAGTITAFSGTGMPSSAEMPWENPEVPEERQPSSKAFKFGTYNSTVLLEKFQCFPKAIWEMTVLTRLGRQRAQLGKEEPSTNDTQSSGAPGHLGAPMEAPHSPLSKAGPALRRNVTEELLTYLIWCRIIRSLMSVLITLTEGKGSNLTANI